MKLNLILLLLIPHIVWADIDIEHSVQEVIEVQKVEEAKFILLSKVVMEVLEKRSGELGIDFSAFKKKITEKFDYYSEQKKIRLAIKSVGVTDKKDPLEKDSNVISLEKNRLSDWAQFLKPNSILHSYGFKDLEKGPENSWKATVVAKIDQSKLKRWLNYHMSKDDKQFSNLHLLTEVQLMGFPWGELGVDSSDAFSVPLTNSWVSQLSQFIPPNLADISSCLSECQKNFYEWMQQERAIGPLVLESFQDDLWLKINLNITRSYLRALSGEWELSWRGSIILLDSNSKKVLFFKSLPAELKTIKFQDPKDFNSKLASYLFKYVSSYNSQVLKSIQDAQRHNRLSRISIRGHRRIDDILSLMDKIIKQGVDLNLTAELEHFSANEATLKFYFFGIEKTFTDLLSQIKELKLSHSYKVIHDFSGNRHQLRLMND